MTDGTGTTPQPSITDCRCGWWLTNGWVHGAAALHDSLTTFESRGLAGVLDVLEALRDARDMDPEARALPGAHLTWVDAGDFVVEHNWTDPVAVADLFDHFHGAFRDRKRLTEVEETIELFKVSMDVLRRAA